MTATAPRDVDYEAGTGTSAADYPTLAAKLEQAAAVTATALDAYDRPVVLWTGGKDSTLVLYVVREVARERGEAVPPVLFIDHFAHFPETLAFAERWADEWDLDLRVVRNERFAALDPAVGDEFAVADLDGETRAELDRLDYDGETLTFDPDSLAGNHLLKTVPLNDALRAGGFDAAFSGVRWDEQEARAEETFFSPRHDDERAPSHDRVQPVLQFDERAVWDAFWNVVVPDAVEGYPEGHAPESAADLPTGVAVEDLPVSPKYWEGFRSLGTESGSGAAADDPAWVQDLGDGGERAGRAQDKEDLMGRLRDLGYM
ncbi:phosphoadenosine phosphosulfate reductase family protein [Candidatus Halobonum tyrrellensis]|uniref:phosphoadenosine phosphosulfate reductase family protein n=1 Tax=Candidatus Halobonum tyrrellensis TaxID=1431545 RepID=UPI00373AED7E